MSTRDGNVCAASRPAPPPPPLRGGPAPPLSRWRMEIAALASLDRIQSPFAVREHAMRSSDGLQALHRSLPLAQLPLRGFERQHAVVPCAAKTFIEDQHRRRRPDRRAVAPIVLRVVIAS